jgi:hypothetical protein
MSNKPVPKIGPLAAEISAYLWDTAKAHREINPPSIPWSEFPYAEAILRWEATGRPPRSRFVTTDSYFLAFRNFLEAKYGLRIITEEEAKAEPPPNAVIPVDGYTAWIGSAEKVEA